jgi:hypothetical protein
MGATAHVTTAYMAATDMTSARMAAAASATSSMESATTTSAACCQFSGHPGTRRDQTNCY